MTPMFRLAGVTVRRRTLLSSLFLTVFALVLLFGPSSAASAQSTTGKEVGTAPTAPKDPGTSAGTASTSSSTSGPTGTSLSSGTTGASGAAISLDLRSGQTSGDGTGPVQIIVLVTLLSIGPAILMLVTSFTRIVIVLGLTRNALNLQGVPPNQVIIGLSLFLTIFVMSPVLTKVNDDALKPYLNHQITQEEALDRGSKPVKEFMAKQVRESDLAMFIDLSGKERPADVMDVPFTTLVPAFVIGELRAAFIIGFVIFIPFLIIDLVVSASLMSMGMVMVQPMTVALPFKLLLFVLVDGWQLLAGSLIRSFVR
jgi:flagellar biosynthetic protein FliP